MGFAYLLQPFWPFQSCMHASYFESCNPHLRLYNPVGHRTWCHQYTGAFQSSHSCFCHLPQYKPRYIKYFHKRSNKKAVKETKATKTKTVCHLSLFLQACAGARTRAMLFFYQWEPDCEWKWCKPQESHWFSSYVLYDPTVGLLYIQANWPCQTNRCMNITSRCGWNTKCRQSGTSFLLAAAFLKGWSIYLV